MIHYCYYILGKHVITTSVTLILYKIGLIIVQIWYFDLVQNWPFVITKSVPIIKSVDFITTLFDFIRK